MYEEHSHFSGKPFQLSRDRRFFFNSDVHRRATAYLRYGLGQGEGFIVNAGGIEPRTSGGTAGQNPGQRVATLEQTGSELRAQMQKDRALLKKAILLKLETEPNE